MIWCTARVESLSPFRPMSLGEATVCRRCGQGCIRAATTRDQALFLQICDECEAAWNQGVNPHAEAFVDLRDLLACHGISLTMTVVWADST